MENCSIQRDFLSKLAEDADAHNIKKIENAFVHKVNKDYVLISEIKEVPENYLNNDGEKDENCKFLYLVAFPKHDCVFCFDHELDHLPFMMTIELIRQAGIAIGHVIHKIPLKGFTNIMDCMNLNVLKFIELDVPLLIIINDIMLKNKPSRQERVMHFYLYQKNSLCASVDINASIMEKDIYRRLRLSSRAELIQNTSLDKVPTTNLQMLNKRISIK